MKFRNIVIIGTLPLPCGGVTIHLERLCHAIAGSAVKSDVLFLDYKKQNLIYVIYNFLGARICHLNFSNKKVRFLLVIFAFILRKKIVITYHGKYNFSHILDLFVLSLANVNLVLNEYSFYSAKKKTLLKTKVLLVSAFIPPKSDLGLVLSEGTKNLVGEFAVKFDNIICTNSHKYVLDSDAHDLYRIDMILKCSLDFPEIGVIIADPSGELHLKYNAYVNQHNVLFITRPEPFVEILKKSHVFIRATTTDGDSLSVKEALFIGIKVLASDCVDRPKGCILFKTNDIESYKSSLKTVLSDEKPSKKRLVDGSVQFIRVYKTLLKK
jgi:hypothetical protein